MVDTNNESEQADFALAAEEVMAAIPELHERSGIDDVLGRLPADDTGLPG